MAKAESGGAGEDRMVAGGKPGGLPAAWVPWLFAASCLATLLIQFASRPGVSFIPDGDLIKGCAAPASLAESVPVFVGEVEWQSKFLLEAVIAAFAFLLAASVIRNAAMAGWGSRRKALAILLGMGAALLLVDVAIILSMRGEGASAGLTAWLRGKFAWMPGHQGFLTRLLDTLGDSCHGIRLRAVWGRLAGEPAGFCIGIAMYAATLLPAGAAIRDLARRSRTLNHLLYAASLLFVAGLLMSGANFSLILDQWKWDAYLLEGLSRDKIIERGVELAGVAYSAILAVFFLPTRALLEARIRAEMDGQPQDLEAQENWRKENGFNGGWKEDVRQILAILAPVITAPLFKAMVE